MSNSLVGILRGSESDRPLMFGAVEVLRNLLIRHETRLPRYTGPQMTSDYLGAAAERGVQVLIASAGAAVHLPGIAAAATTLPVIGVPLPRDYLEGLDSLLSAVRMPVGLPVATVTIGAAGNAALLAARILAVSRPGMRLAVERAEIELLAASRSKSRPTGPAPSQRLH